MMKRSTVFETLHTDSLIEAKRLQPAAVARLRALIDAARHGPASVQDPLAEEALRLKEMDVTPIAEALRDFAVSIEKNTAVAASLIDVEVPQAPSQSWHFEGAELKTAILDARVRGVKERHGAHRASEFSQIANGTGTPILLHVEVWIAQAELSRRTVQKYSQAINTLINWLKAKKKPCLFEVVDRKLAYAFRDEELAKRHPETANSLLGGLRAYWTWAIDRQKIEGENHWQAVRSIPKRSRPKSDRQRGFREEEIVALFFTEIKCNSRKTATAAPPNHGDCLRHRCPFRRDRSPKSTRRIVWADVDQQMSGS